MILLITAQWLILKSAYIWLQEAHQHKLWDLWKLQSKRSDDKNNIIWLPKLKTDRSKAPAYCTWCRGMTDARCQNTYKPVSESTSQQSCPFTVKIKVKMCWQEAFPLCKSLGEMSWRGWRGEEEVSEIQKLQKLEKILREERIQMPSRMFLILNCSPSPIFSLAVSQLHGSISEVASPSSPCVQPFQRAGPHVPPDAAAPPPLTFLCPASPCHPGPLVTLPFLTYSPEFSGPTQTHPPLHSQALCMRPEACHGHAAPGSHYVPTQIWCTNSCLLCLYHEIKSETYSKTPVWTPQAVGDECRIRGKHWLKGQIDLRANAGSTTHSSVAKSEPWFHHM